MKFNFFKASLSLALCSTLMASCVSSKKYEDLQASKEALEREKAASQQKVDELTASLRDREKRLADVERALNEQQKILDNLKNDVNAALKGFNQGDLSVNIKDGKVYVSLSDKLLFPTGSTKVNPSGKKAIDQLVEVLKKNQQVGVVVEGHTDDVSVASGMKYLTDNWDLSVLRATEITRMMTEKGLSPDRVTAAGRSFYMPVDTGRSADAKAKNRRTEIILAPDFSDVYKILGIQA
ncbi:chemotaxis protein MotB [Pontibacter ummariensis]|uniref:Chemotaxis protein MotB n=1 Tax=Pontibacter ummariensis TaxID=1610492 RepID=A0A239BA42_9BACT|nr:OmpA family protein [Pontibacter ummariensis]PRY16404.1 chemotaxis protein MotB [Pontibacter ummariensis]SNS04569.1 chemotaxis protein MotB [Pontibacter ummariensis]